MEQIPEEHNPDLGKNLILKSLAWPVFFASVMWIVKLIETFFDFNFAALGLFPRKIEGLIGIITSPFIHADYLHLISNTIPFIILGSALIYFYRSISFRVFILIFLLTGVWVWLAGRPSYHIGASGVVYGLAFFLFLSGIFRKDRGLMAFSLLVVFLYGSIIWGIVPLESGMSWEGHLFGALSGVICAIAFKKEGPQRKKFEWEDEDDDDEEATGNDGDENAIPGQQPPEVQVHYTIKSKTSGEPPGEEKQ